MVREGCGQLNQFMFQDDGNGLWLCELRALRRALRLELCVRPESTVVKIQLLITTHPISFAC